MPEPNDVEFKLKSQMRVVQSQKLCFGFINTTFGTAIEFNKNKLMEI